MSIKRTRRVRRDRNHILYRIDCTVTGEYYIGLSGCIGRKVAGTLAERFRRHCSKAMHEAHRWTLHKRIRRYGPQKFRAQVLLIVRGRDAAFQEERRLIRTLRPALNTF
jgi:hypothetical protein